MAQNKTAQIGVRLDADLVVHVDNLARQLSASTLEGRAPSRSAVIRAAITRGLAIMQAEIKAKKR
jgi:Arc/MetJ-type ribon-helix-helix transcriptional regulator